MQIRIAPSRHPVPARPDPFLSFNPLLRMAKKTRKGSAPLTFDLPVSLIDRIEECRKAHDFKNASEVVRLAISSCNFDNCEPARDDHRQISVRVTSDQRAILKRYAKTKNASVGELLRIAVEALPAKAAKKKK